MAAASQLDKTNADTSAGHPPAGHGTRGTSAGSETAMLPNQLKGLWRTATGGISGLSSRQQKWLLVGGGLLLAALAAIVWSGTQTDWKTLYAGLDPEDTRQMGQVLTQAQIVYDVSANGTAIRVPAGQLDKARLATAAKGGPRSGRLGFEIFDKPNWVGSEFDEQVNYQRALEGELEHTVATLGDIQSARVHLVMAHDSLFREQERPAKAAVVLTLRHRSLADGEADSIRNLVASAVDGLTPARVSIVDAAGHLPLGAKTVEAERLALEQELESKLVATLEPVTGAGNVRASVTLDYDPTSSEVTEESYDPDQSATLTMQRTEQTTGAQPIPAGIPGTATNAPNSQALPVYPQQSTAPQSAKSESGTYGVSRKVRHVTEPAGHLRRLTAAIVVNDRMQAVAKKGAAVTWAPRSAEELRNLTALAQAAVGFDTGRGDLLTVEDLAFDENRNAIPPSPAKQALQMAESSPVLVKYLALTIGLLLLIVFAIRPAFKSVIGTHAKGKRELAAGAQQAALPAQEQTHQELERDRVQHVFQQVSDQLKRDPTQSSRLLQSWIQSD